MFLSLLHDEADPEFEDLCVKSAATELGLAVKDPIVAALKNDHQQWPAVKEVMENFRSLSSLNPPILVRALFELKHTSYITHPWSIMKKKELISCHKYLRALGLDHSVKNDLLC